MNKQLILAILSILLICISGAAAFENMSINQSLNEQREDAVAEDGGQDGPVDDTEAVDAEEDEPVDEVEAEGVGQDKKGKETELEDTEKDKKGDDSTDLSEVGSLAGDQEKENGNPNPGLGIRSPNSKR